MKGKLYLCATPIGNLEDISLRVLRVLKEADIIGAEDTRNSIKLLNYFDIKTPMTSYHEYNKVEKAKYLVRLMEEGKNVAIVTDAGTPGISDPGEEIVRQCIEANIEVTSLPGAAACVTALTISGMPTGRFTFEAFLPAEKKERRRILDELKNDTRTIVMYEAPHHLVKTLKDILENIGDRKISLCRELTKKHETVIRGSVSEMLKRYETEIPRGEYVLVMEGRSVSSIEQERYDEWNKIPIDEHMNRYISEGMTQKEAMKKTAADRGVSKRDIYKYWMNVKRGVESENDYE